MYGSRNSGGTHGILLMISKIEILLILILLILILAIYIFNVVLWFVRHMGVDVSLVEFKNSTQPVQ